MRYATRLIREALDEAANDAMTLEDEGADSVPAAELEADQRPNSRAEIEAEVKRALTREWSEAEADLSRTEGSLHFCDY